MSVPHGGRCVAGQLTSNNIATGGGSTEDGMCRMGSELARYCQLYIMSIEILKSFAPRAAMSSPKSKTNSRMLKCKETHTRSSIIGTKVADDAALVPVLVLAADMGAVR